MVHDGIIQRRIAVFLAHLDHAWDLMGFALADEVGHGRVKDQDFQGGQTPLAVDAFKKVLRHDAFERLGQGGADFVLLFRRKNVNNTIYRFGGALRMQRAKNQVPRAGRR